MESKNAVGFGFAALLDVTVTPCHTMPPGYDWLGCLRWLNRDSVRHVRSWCSCDVAYGFSKALFMPTRFYDCGDLEFSERLSPELEAEIAAELEEPPAVLAPDPEEPPRMYGPARISPEPGMIVEVSTTDPGVQPRKRRNPEPILGGPAYAAKLRRMKFQ